MFATKKGKWMAKGIARSDLYRKWLAHKLLSDLPRAARHRWDEFEPDDVLRHVGLTTYKPVRAGLGGLGVFLLGMAAGGVVALLLAPKTGTELRTTVKDKAAAYMNKQNVNLGQERTANA